MSIFDPCRPINSVAVASQGGNRAPPQSLLKAFEYIAISNCETKTEKLKFTATKGSHMLAT